MTLRAQSVVAVATGGSDLSLQAQANESYLIRRINHYDTADAAEDCDVSVDRRRIFQVSVPSGWRFLTTRRDTPDSSFADLLYNMGYWPSIPVASGQQLDVTNPTGSGAVEVVYDIYERGDVQASQPNGTQSSRNRIFQTISNSTAGSKGDTRQLDQSDLDSIFPAFPGGDVVPARHRVELLGLFGAPLSLGDSADNVEHSDRIRFIREREDLFDQDLNGFLFVGDQNYIVNTVLYAANQGRLDVPRGIGDAPLIWFPDPITFEPGEELNVEMTFTSGSGSGSISAGDAKLGLIYDLVRVG